MSLIVRSAFDAGLDMTAADPNDPAWIRRLGIHLHEQSRRDRLDVVTMQYQEALAVLSSGLLSAEGVTSVQGNLEQLGKKRRKLLQPWSKIEVSEVARAGSVSSLTDAWKNVWGDPNSPETKARIDKTVEWLTKNSRATHG